MMMMMGVAAGASHTAAVTADGRLFTFGDGRRGRLDHGEGTGNELVPREVAGLREEAGRVVCVTAGHTACVVEAGCTRLGMGTRGGWGWEGR